MIVSPPSKTQKFSSPLLFVIMIGLCSLFADMTYEGARSITGPFLSVLGASAFAVGFIAGAGELIGYTLRILFGWLSDRTQRYWIITISGYIINMLAVPVLALAGSWEMAALLMVLERTGKAVRTPARDAMLSHATRDIGHGWGFGLHEALDQIGAMLGPLIVSVVLALRGDYRESFAVLLVPALITILILLIARAMYPKPHMLNTEEATANEPQHFPKRFWWYVAAVSMVAMGYADFSLIAFHFQRTAVIPEVWIPLLYAIAMGVDALSALFFGRLFDRTGLIALMIAILLSTLFAPMVFMGGFATAVLGMVLWGLGMGAQESIMKAAVAQMVPAKRRGRAFGILDAGYGLLWFAGSAMMGFLYEISISRLVIFSMMAQLLSLPMMWSLRRRHRPLHL